MSETPLAASIIVNTYNNADRLRLVLPAYLKQTLTDFEIIVADDGSTDNSEIVVAEFAKTTPFPVSYIRHELQGHNRATILNKATLAARSDFIIYTDADCLPVNNLVELHVSARKENALIIGGRIMLKKEETKTIGPKEINLQSYKKLLTPKRQRSLTKIHLTNLLYIATNKKRRPHNYALNMSIEKWAMFAVNGFDQEMRGWGDLDGELRERLKRIGVKPRCICNKAIVYHLNHHKIHSRFKTRRNRIYARRPNLPIWCKNGIFQQQIIQDQTRNAPAETRFFVSEENRYKNRKWSCQREFLPILEKEILPALYRLKFESNNRKSRSFVFIDTTIGRLFIKKYNVKNKRISQTLAALFHSTRSFKEWNNHVEAWRRNTNCPEPLAFSEKFSLSLEYTSYFIMYAMHPALKSFRDGVTLNDSTSSYDKNRAISNTVLLLAHMHDQGLFHLDYTDMHIWGNAESGQWQPTAIINFEKFIANDSKNDALALASLERARNKLKNISRREALRALSKYLKARKIEKGSTRYTLFYNKLASSG